MNGFEPLRRRVIDYTVAGQWQEVYDGPIEECEEYRLQAENAKLRELVCWMYNRMDESCAAQYTYAPAPINYDQLMQAAVRARELGVEVADG